MADNTFGRQFGVIKRTNWMDFWIQTVFVGFLFLIFIGLAPFSVTDDLNAQLLASVSGDTIRQITFTGLFIVLVGISFIVRGLTTFKAYPFSLAIVLLWCLISVSWSIDPALSFRRLLYTVFVTSCVMHCVDMLGPQRSLQSLRLVLMVTLIVNLLSVLIIPEAIHLPSELEGELAGSWRGMHNHKNIAGPVAALSALLFFHQGITSRRWLDWLLFVAATIFLLGTQSKTALGFFLLSILASSTYRAVYQNALGRQVLALLFFGMLVFATVTWVISHDAIAELMSDPSSFTGRVSIWNIVFTYLQDHWLLGSGFGSFWLAGDSSPLTSIAPEKWAMAVAHSHSGYLEILVTTGIVGFVLSIFAFVVVPVLRIFYFRPGDLVLRSLLFSFFCFVVFSDLLETEFLYRDHPAWIIFLITLAILHQISSKNTDALDSPFA
jgi:exopolysaccharide production protein ExoQ